jgi:hypothetical protein
MSAVTQSAPPDGHLLGFEVHHLKALGSVVSDRIKVFFWLFFKAGFGREDACQNRGFDLASSILDLAECLAGGVPDGSGGLLAIDASLAEPPVPVAAEDLVELVPDPEALAAALAEHLSFACGDWGGDGPLRRVGTAQGPDGRTTPVLLFLPSGLFADTAIFLASLTQWSHATLLVPTSRWMTTAATQLATGRAIVWVALDQHFASATPPPVLATPPVANGKPAIRPIIKPVSNLTWGMVTVEIRSGASIAVHAPGQSGEFIFPAQTRRSADSPLGILMQLAVKGTWQNPSIDDPDYERISQAFRRLRILLAKLIPLPGKPFKRSSGAFVPVFQLRLHQDLILTGTIEILVGSGENTVKVQVDFGLGGRGQAVSPASLEGGVRGSGRIC